MLRAHPENADAHHSRGLVLQLQGKTEQAIEEYHEVLRMRPGNFDAQIQPGRALLTQGKLERGDLRRAQSELEQAIRLKPDDLDTYNDLGMVHAQEGNMAQAVRQFEEALRINPEHEGARENLKRAQAERLLKKVN